VIGAAADLFDLGREEREELPAAAYRDAEKRLEALRVSSYRLASLGRGTLKVWSSDPFDSRLAGSL
jgi:hypothetical protein